MDKRMERTNAALYKALADYLQEHPKQLPSIKELCLKAKVNRATFYRNFKDIDTLIYSAIGKMADMMVMEVNGVEEILNNPRTALEDISRVREKYSDGFSIIREEHRLFFKEKLEDALIKRLDQSGVDYSAIKLCFIIGGVFNIFSYGLITSKIIDELEKMIVKLS